MIKNNKASLTDCGGGVERKLLAHGGGLMTTEVCFKKGAVGALHTHTHEQVSYIAKGSFEYTLGNDTFLMEVGDSVYVPSNTPHATLSLQEGSVIVDVFTPQREDFK